MLILDLFSGMKGFSKPFKDRGHFIITVDNQEFLNPSLCIDIRDSKINWDIDVDIVLASPPCTEFSRDSMPWIDSEKPDTSLVAATKRIIDTVKPKFYVVENVRGSIKYIKDYFGDYKMKIGPRYLWGYFPDILHSDLREPKKTDMYGPHRHLMRAKMPYEIGERLCISMERFYD